MVKGWKYEFDYKWSDATSIHWTVLKQNTSFEKKKNEFSCSFFHRDFTMVFCVCMCTPNRFTFRYPYEQTRNNFDTQTTREYYTL
jgi:hypothetical protein